MKLASKTAAAVLLALVALICQAQQAGAQAVVTAARVAMPEGAFSGPLYVTVGGKEKKIEDDALKAWIIQGGQQVVYSGKDGAGGFENEGQSLRVYDARTGRIRKVMAEYVAVDEVTEVTTSRNKTALLVEMVDGGLGASYLAVVDPARGEVFFRRWVKVISRKGDIVVLGHYKEDDWNSEDANVKPYRTERLNLNTILGRRVIYNKPDR